MLGEGIQITDLAKWLGHKNINITYATYGHLLPSAAKIAVTALDAEYARWTASAPDPELKSGEAT
jgi:integrase